VQKSERDVKNL